MKNCKINFEKLDWIIVNDGARYKVHQDGETMVRLIEFFECLQHPEWCLNGHIAYVLEGRLQMKFSTTTEIYETGDVLVIPEGDECRHIPRPLSPVVRLFSVEKILTGG